MGSVLLMAAMLGSGRNQLSRSLLRQVTTKKGGDVRSLSSLVTLTSKNAAVKVGLAKEVKVRQQLVWDSTVARGLRTSAVMRDEVKEIVCPAFADSISERDVRWEKAVGDSVAKDDVICEIETDKTSVPVPSPAAGVITELLVEDGATVSPGTKLLKMKLGAGGAAPAAAKPAAPEVAAPAPAAAAPPPPPPPAAAAAPPPPPQPPPPCPAYASCS